MVWLFKKPYLKFTIEICTAGLGMIQECKNRETGEPDFPKAIRDICPPVRPRRISSEISRMVRLP